MKHLRKFLGLFQQFLKFRHLHLLLQYARFNPQTGVTETGGLRHAVVDNAKILRHWEYYFNFSNAPTTTDDVSAAGGSNDEMHIAIVDEDGGISGTPV